jgi:MYXO-CTERM domain-containing protein
MHHAPGHLRLVRSLSLLASVSLASHWSCAVQEAIDGPEPEPTGQVAYALGTVQDAVNASCSTSSVFGLSKQIVDQVNCLVPSALSPVPSRPNLALGSATFAFLQTAARDKFVAALDANPGKSLGINSMLRTVAQQYLLYAWYLAGKCGIPLAAKPGNSNHEDGLAFDTNDYTAWTTPMAAYSFKWYGTADKYHFDYIGSGTKDLSGKDVLAFQMLWNLNHPTDLIAEDGLYGPQTEARLKQTPADGFAKGPNCAAPDPLDATFVSQGSDAPPDPEGKAHFQVCTGAAFHFWFELKNKGTVVWTDEDDTTAGHWGKAVRLGTPGDKTDVLTGLTRVTVANNENSSVDPKGGDCNDKPGCSRTVFIKGPGIEAKAPDAPGIYKTEWRLVDENRGWFGPTMWLDFSVVACQSDAGTDQPAAPEAAPEASPVEAGEPDAEPDAPVADGSLFNVNRGDDGGCSCRAAGARSSGGGVLLLLLAGALAAARRSRRA